MKPSGTAPYCSRSSGSTLKSILVQRELCELHPLCGFCPNVAQISTKVWENPQKVQINAGVAGAANSAIKPLQKKEKKEQGDVIKRAPVKH